MTLCNSKKAVREILQPFLYSAGATVITNSIQITGDFFSPSHANYKRMPDESSVDE
jgi:hypothetical protein